MRVFTPIALLALTLGVGACRSSRPTTELRASDAARRNEWKASLFSPSGLAGAMQIRGTAVWSREGDAASLATVNISNATPGGCIPGMSTADAAGTMDPSSARRPPTSHCPSMTKATRPPPRA